MKKPLPNSPASLGTQGVTRRGLLASTGAGAVGLGLGVAADRIATGIPPTPDPPRHGQAQVPFDGEHQAGIATPTQNYLQFAAFDFAGDSIIDLRQLLETWTAAARTLTRGFPLPANGDLTQPPADPGEAIGLPAASLTITIGFGPTLFEQDGQDRLGLRASKPTELATLPPFQGEGLDPSRSGGDLCVQACAEDPQVAFHAIHVLNQIGSTSATLRWLQSGFGRTSTTSRSQTTPRNLMGFKDGTSNIHNEDTAAMNQYVWVPPTDQPAWMTGGTYLALRRIRMLLDVWDATSLTGQEQTIGRDKLSGAPLGGTRENDPVNLTAQYQGAPVIPADAHIRLANPQLNDGQRILRRGYSYSDGYDPATGQLDAGLFFIAYQRSPTHQFIPIQQRLAANDALNHHTLHTASAIFAIPPGTTQRGYIGDTLL